KHQVNYIVSKQRCLSCIDDETSDTCVACDERKHVFEGENSLDEFCKYVFSWKKKKFNVTAIAHNSSGFNYIIKNNLTKKHVNERNEIIPSFKFKNIVDFLSPLKSD